MKSWKKNSNVLISDEGVTTSHKHLEVNFFVLICRAVSLALAALGLLDFIEGNF